MCIPMKNILLMCSFGARADEPARASSGRAHEKFVAGDSGGGTVDEGTAAAAPTDSRSNANKRSPRRARHGGDSGDGSATAPFVIDTVARARYPLGLRCGMTARWGGLLGSPRALDAQNCFPSKFSQLWGSGSGFSLALGPLARAHASTSSWAALRRVYPRLAPKASS